MLEGRSDKIGVIVSVQSTSEYATTQEQAKAKAGDFRKTDPLPDVPQGLLSSEHIQAYVAATAMIHPFYPIEKRLKAASYEVNAGGRFIYWKEGKKTILDLHATNVEGIRLPANSISFVELESLLYLPDYIALRFNLRIQHVHRGLLLGTGPLVDPGFHGNLLIPLHNLTAEDYFISKEEGLIWVEFTKTTRGAASTVPTTNKFEFFETDRTKTNRPIEVYFEKANRNNPIESSIPKAVKDAHEKARESAVSARRAEKASQVWVGIGALAVLGAVVGLSSFLLTASAHLRDNERRAIEAEHRATDAEHKAQDAKSTAERVGQQLEQSRVPQPPPSGDQRGPRLENLEQRVQALENRAATVPRVQAPPKPLQKQRGRRGRFNHRSR
jgi:deoxycytidine triphosphate deaminase